MQMSRSVTYTRDGDVGIVTLDNPPVNALSQHVRQGLLDSFTAASGDDTRATAEFGNRSSRRLGECGTYLRRSKAAPTLFRERTARVHVHR